MQKLIFGSFVTVAALATCSSTLGQAVFTATNITPTGIPGMFGVGAADLNNKGDVALVYNLDVGGGNVETNSLIWTRNGSDIFFNGETSLVTKINSLNDFPIGVGLQYGDFGNGPEVVGSTFSPNGYMWPQQMPGGQFTEYTDINNQFDICGNVYIGGEPHAFLVEDGIYVYDINPPFATSSNANAVNEDGDIVGTAVDMMGSIYGIHWDAVTYVPFAVLASPEHPDLSVIPTAINNNDTIVGWLQSDGHGDAAYSLPFVSSTFGQPVVVLPLLEGFSNGGANSINEQGVIVGTCLDDVGNVRATMWRNGVAIDLNLATSGIPDGVTLIDAVAISDKKHIACNAIGPNGAKLVYLLH